ncbi:DUF4437 domain-containing protein [Persicirhabdus sediminis]|uniref:DUF4437 domain-containing protein n=1 Tax=Persicirhabdus sediminis TaxID=454144 RepID=A0A8J7SJW1_9BACT|nr:DUF4437 domain-containing protein [Persicirhabdus sediminis]MBK1791624.1 DUF4437 domain-containing protein [Persicirhabdus sediminis]
MKKSTLLPLSALVSLSALIPANAQTDAANNNDKNDKAEVVLLADIDWEQLNPARGDQSPQAGTLWGDRKADVATGYLGVFTDGFSSPPHIHNVSYRALVISGLMHNDDPSAEKMWMPAGSFWTQPQGEAHITAAKGDKNIAYIEIDSGPYLVEPTEQAFDNGERPINVHSSNIVWLSASDSSWIESNDPAEDGKSPQITHLWGKPVDGQLNGSMIKLPAGYSGKISGTNDRYRAIIISGNPSYSAETNADGIQLEPGCYFSSNKSGSSSFISSKDECIIYIRAIGRYQLSPNKE